MFLLCITHAAAHYHKIVNEFLYVYFTGDLLKMEQISNTHILFFDLNDNCLLHICEKLQVADLCALHGTSNQFSTLSVLAYKLEYGDSFINPFAIKMQLKISITK